MRQDTEVEFRHHARVKAWRKQVRFALACLVWACLNLTWSLLRLRIWWIIVVNISSIIVITYNFFTALKWYHAYRERGERLQELLDELFGK